MAVCINMCNLNYVLLLSDSHFKLLFMDKVLDLGISYDESLKGWVMDTGVTFKFYYPSFDQRMGSNKCKC